MFGNKRLSKIIRESSVQVVNGFYWYLKDSNLNSYPNASLFAQFFESGETTQIVVTDSNSAPTSNSEIQGPYSLFSFSVSIPFNAPGFLAKIAKTVADEGYPVLLLSTFSKDYALIRYDQCEQVRAALQNVGFRFEA